MKTIRKVVISWFIAIGVLFGVVTATTPMTLPPKGCKTVLKGLGQKEIVVDMEKGQFKIAVVGEEGQGKVVKAKCIAIEKSFGSRGMFA